MVLSSLKLCSKCPGILLLAGQEGKMFLTSYIEDGILHFKVTLEMLP